MNKLNTNIDILFELITPIILINKFYIIEYINPAGEEFFASSSSLLLGKHVRCIINDNSPLLLLISRVLKTKNGLTEDSLNIGNHNKLNKHIRVHIVPCMNQKKNIIRQISEHSVFEKNKIQKEKKKISNSFSSMISMLMHELRNPLAGIKGASQLLENDTKENIQHLELTQLIQIETDRIANLLNRMEVISAGKGILFCEHLNIHKILMYCRKIIQNSFGKNISFVEIYDPSLPKIFAHEDLLIQIFLNIFKNATEALNGIGQIKVITSFNANMRVSSEDNNLPIYMPLQIEIIDNGPGINSDLLPNIFDPFVSNKNRGSGLGLTIVSSALNELGGNIDVVSEIGETNFCINFPLK